jgi:pyruvate/2-oxoglutarate dehydrogenase complex dihydrolipoamide dehydrogenase (E3) component
MHHFDLSVIGSGPGGQRAATQAAKLRKHAAICEKS